MDVCVRGVDLRPGTDHAPAPKPCRCTIHVSLNVREFSHSTIVTTLRRRRAFHMPQRMHDVMSPYHPTCILTTSPTPFCTSDIIPTYLPTPSPHPSPKATPCTKHQSPLPTYPSRPPPPTPSTMPSPPPKLPHSATVRGTFAHANFSKNNIAPPLGDPVSLEHEKIDGKSPSPSAPSTKALDPYDNKARAEGGMADVEGGEAGSQGNKSMLGDAVSLEMERKAGRSKL